MALKVRWWLIQLFYDFNTNYIVFIGSQMPRHLISDAHEWINEIPTVPIYYLAKPQPRERAWQNQRGKKTLSIILNGVQKA
jgi:hypothetical protein